MLKYLFILIFTLIIYSNSFAQVNEDSLAIIEEQGLQTSQMSKSPSSALWRSVIPGWGQYYNEEYWKAPLLLGSAVGLGGLIYYFNSEFNSFSEELENATRNGTKIEIENPEELNDTFYPIRKKVLNDLEIKQLKGNRELNRDSRDMMAFYLLGVYVISAVDAYVGAHLYDFNVDDELSYNMNINKFGYPEFAFSYSF